MSNYIDIEVRVWQRLHFNEKTNMWTLIERIKNGEDPDELCGDDSTFELSETLYETAVQLKPEEVEGNATIEVYTNDIQIWNNQKEEEG